ncbi:XrtA/PEP-CTERM system histidine kinase PrsK [Salinisphaera sp. T31B1]|uniref:XrtA/PEP-CTERM system histidine kinase PrsK n=1 Tax=Salinisphaera sp. T31B1 TaxID=727963 RepID=UPI00333E9EF0
MFPSLTPTDLWLLSNTAAAVAYAVATLLVLAIERQHAAMRLLLVACGLNTLWFTLLTLAPIIGLTAPALDLAETVRTAFWVALAAWLVPPGAVPASRRRLQVVAVVLPVLSGLYLLWRVVSTYGVADASTPHSTIFAACICLITLWGLMLLEQTWRVSSTDARWGMKYLCLAIATVLGYDFLMYSFALVNSYIDASVWDARGAVNTLAAPLIVVSALRNASWSARLGVSHRAVFSTGVMLSAGIYLLAMVAGSYYLRHFGGDWADVAAVLFLAAATLGLMILLLSGQVRAYLRVFINKHLFHYTYDYREEWLALMRRLSQRQPGVDAYGRAVRAVAAPFQSTGGAVWVRRDEAYVCAAAWNLPDAAEIVVPADSDLIAYLHEHEWIIELADADGKPRLDAPSLTLPEWLVGLDRGQLLMPLPTEDRLLGFLVLSAPRVPMRLGWEEIDLLKTLGRQIGVFLDQQESNLALAEARQFEAFNRLTAFLMHDLKNIAGQQSLMLQNAGRHRHNPAFVDDMILTIENSVDRMRQLLDQLQRVSSDARPPQRVVVRPLLDALITELAVSEPAPKIGQAADAVVCVDPERLRMVLRHLIKNGQDATSAGGEVTIDLVADEQWVRINIVDDGEGMTQVFVRESLFKPFFSTRAARGMGIGAFQAREFARDAGGDVEVQTAPGEGTRFSLILPRAAGMEVDQ